MQQAVAIAWHLAVRQVRRGWLSTLCYVVALAAVLAPLLVLWGLRYGVVGEMERRLLRNPTKLEIAPIPTLTLPSDFFGELAARPEVGFLVPRTRPLSLIVFMEGAGGQLVKADLEPTAAGDPLLLPGSVVPQGRDGIVLSHGLAGTLGAEAGDEVPLVVTRSQDGFDQFEELSLKVLQVLPQERSARSEGFVSQALITAIEDYRDGYAVPEFGWPGGRGARTGARPYAGFRLYARDLAGVPALVDWLRDHGLATASQVEEVRGLRLLDRSLGTVFAIILGIASAGVIVSLGSNLWANVERSRKDLSVVRLMGGRSGVLVSIPILEALVVALAGFALAALGYWISDLLLMAAFEAPGIAGGDICRLTVGHWIVAFCATVIAAVLAASNAAYRALSIPPAEGFQ